MITVPPGMRILLATRPVDFRKGMDGLAALVQQALQADPFAGDVFIFRPRRSDRVRILAYDGTGLCVSWSCCLSKAGPRRGRSVATSASHHRRAGSGGSRPPARR